jgi:predicted NBD/HSP70 family sugar kinase
MRADEQRLRVIVANNANAAISAEFWQISFEFRPEVVVFDVMNGSTKPG